MTNAGTPPGAVEESSPEQAPPATSPLRWRQLHSDPMVLGAPVDGTRLRVGPWAKNELLRGRREKPVAQVLRERGQVTVDAGRSRIPHRHGGRPRAGRR
jgi:hypothetical protein